MYSQHKILYSHLNMETLVEIVVNLGLYESESEDYDQIYCHVNMVTYVETAVN